MSIRPAVAIAAGTLILGGFAAVPAQAAPTTPQVGAGMKMTFFKTPSGNIRCGMFRAGGKWSMRCDVYDHSWVAPGPNPCGGTGDYGSSVGMGRKGHPRFLCVSDAMDNGPTLTYGKSLSYGPFYCKSRPKGLKCYNAKGHGWFLSRESYRFF